MASLNDILNALQNGVQAINRLNSQLSLLFPAVSASTTAPPAGTITFTSSQASGFALVTTSSGAHYKIALYPSS